MSPDIGRPPCPAVRSSAGRSALDTSLTSRPGRQRPDVTREDWATLARAGGATFPRHPWVGCAEEVPKEATVAPQVETKAERREAGRPEGGPGFCS